MLLRSPQPIAAQEKKAVVKFAVKLDSGFSGNPDKLMERVNKAGEDGWRVKGFASDRGSMYVLMEKER
jgi:hypothetical protein